MIVGDPDLSNSLRLESGPQNRAGVQQWLAVHMFQARQKLDRRRMVGELSETT